MVALHFRRRLHQYIRFRCAPQRELQLKYKDTKRLVDSCFRVRKVPVIDDEGRPTGQSTSVWTEWDATNDPIEKELREWLGIVPWEWQLRQSSAHFVRKLYDMLTWMEMFVEEHPSTRGARLYSFVPVATTFQAAYVKINASTMFGLFARLRSVDSSREWVDEFLWTALSIDPSKKRASDSSRPFMKTTFQTHRSEIMRKVFSVAQFEIKTRKFADEVKTNGNAVSVMMIRPLMTTSVVAVEKTVPKKRMKNDGASAEEAPIKPRVKSPTELAERDSLVKELFKLGTDYSTDVLIGIDPGVRSLVTAVAVGRLRRRRRKRGGGRHRRDTHRANR